MTQRQDEALEILKATNDGNDLSPPHLKIVEYAVNDRLSPLGDAMFERLLKLVREGTYKGLVLDPVREALVRKMVPNPSTWPGMTLRMKRIEGDRIVEWGFIAEYMLKDGKIQISVSDPAEALCTYGSLDELLAAGWAVD